MSISVRRESLVGNLRILPVGLGRGRARHVVARNVVAYRRMWTFLVSGFFEPLFYLLSIGLGLNHFVGQLSLGGQPVSYAAFVAPGLLASSAMNGAIMDSTFNTFFKLKITKTYDAILATPLQVRDVAVGEITWALCRGTFYSASFLVVMSAMGLVLSPWAVLCLPAAMLVGFGFAGLGMGLTCYMRTWQDFDFVMLAIYPLFIFSGVFYPLTVYPHPIAVIVSCSPLYQGVALCRALDAGLVSWVLLVHVAYLAVMGGIGLVIARRRLAALLLP